MMKKNYSILLISLLVICISGCDNNPSSSSSTSKQKTIDDCYTTEQIIRFAGLGYEKMIKDNNFKYGFTLTKVDPKGGNPYHDEKINFYDKFKKNNPDWSIAQWGTKYDIGLDEYKYQIKGKNLVHDLKCYAPKDLPIKDASFDSETGSTYLELNASEEYSSPRKSGEAWPHLLLGQDFSTNGLTRLSDLSSLVIDTTYKVTKCENKMTEEDFDPSVHTAQLVLYLTIQNRIQGHVDFGKYIWFGINLFDYRYAGKEIKKGTQHDIGTGSMIYHNGTADTMKDNNGIQPLVGQMNHVNFDIIEESKVALKAATDQGYFTSTIFSDLYIGGFNFGFEVPGTFNIGVEFKEINFFKK